MFLTLYALPLCILCISPMPAAAAPETPEMPERTTSAVQKAAAPGAHAAPPADLRMDDAPLGAAADAAEGAEGAVGAASVGDSIGDSIEAGAAGLDLLWPVETRSISSAWGPRVRMMTTVVKTHAGNRRVSKPYAGSHKGIDFTAPLGHAVFAAMDGRVSRVGRGGRLGNFVAIDHGGGVETVYGHNSANLVKAGDTVLRGQVIARVGNTGHSTGPHVHFEVRIDGRQVNPMPMLNDTEEISAEMAEHNGRFLRSGKTAG